MSRGQLQRLRWGVRAVLMLGVAASVVANVLHANPNPISQTISAWPPLALLLTVELISRIPVHSRTLGVARVAAAGVIAGIAAWVSYWHMVGVAARYGEDTYSAQYLLPISVDGLIVVASICLVELAGRVALAEPVRVVRGELTAAPVRGPVAEPVVARPAVQPEPPAEPPAPVRTKRVTPRSLTAAERVIAAHRRTPAASHEDLAKAARVSVSTVKRHRPSGSPSGSSPAKTTSTRRSPELVDATA